MTIQSIQRALDVLCLFSKSRPTYRLTDIANSLGLKMPTVHGIVSSLEKNGFLQLDPQIRQYRLGNKIFELGAHFSSSIQINLHAKIHAQDLAQRTNFSNRVGIWDNNSILITLFAFPLEIATTVNNVGPRIVPYCTAIGRAMLAFMDEEKRMAYLDQEHLIKNTKYTITSIDAIIEDLKEIRKRGYAINCGELTLGRAGLAAPIWGPGKRLEGALAIIGNTDQVLGERQNFLANELLETVSRISESLGFVPGEE